MKGNERESNKLRLGKILQTILREGLSLFSHTPQTFQAPPFFVPTPSVSLTATGRRKNADGFFIHQPVSPGEKKFTARAAFEHFLFLRGENQKELLLIPP